MNSTTSCTLFSNTSKARDRAQTSTCGCCRCLVKNYLHNIVHIIFNTDQIEIQLPILVL